MAVSLTVMAALIAADAGALAGVAAEPVVDLNLSAAPAGLPRWEGAAGRDGPDRCGMQRHCAAPQARRLALLTRDRRERLGRRRGHQDSWKG